MFALQKTIERLVRELEAERVESARFRRMMEDTLYNLEEENMPTVSTRIREGEKSIGLLVEDGHVRGSVLVEAINGASAVTIDADKIDLDGKLIVDSINNASGVSIHADKIELDADSIDLDGKVIIDSINENDSVSIHADKIDLDGKLIVETINDSASVTIDASRINLNGAVTANQNFVIHENGSVSCKALSVTGGEILLPDPEDGSPVLRVESQDASGGVTVFADRIAFDGSFFPGWKQEGTLSLEQLMITNEVVDENGVTVKSGVFVAPDALRLTRQEVAGGQAGPLDEAGYTARGIRIPYLRENPKTRTADMLPLYIDKYGRLCAVAE